MKYLISALMSLVTAEVRADGFECWADEIDLDVKIYNHVHPESGTRVGAVMILSDRVVRYGRRTVGRFSSEDGTLTSEGASYQGRVDLRFSDLSRGGEYVAGTRLSEISDFHVNLGFSYIDPVEDGDLVVGTLAVTKRNGKVSSFDLVCSRYLKN